MKNMKRKFFLIWILAGLLSCFDVEAQQLTVADGTSESLYFPLSVYHWTQSQHSQSIYPASMLTPLQGQYITTLTWYFVTMPTLQWDGIQTIRLGVTNDDNLWNGFSTSPTVEVWSGQMSAFFEEGCLRIPLDTAFLYTGGNLLVEVYKPAGGSYGSEHFYGQIQQSSSQTPPLITSLNLVDNYYNVPYEGNILPKLTFTYQDYMCSSPEMLSSSGVTTYTADLSWAPGVLGVADQYQVAYRTAAETSYSEVMVSDTFCTLSNLIPNTHYYWKVKALCGDSASSDWSLERTFTTLRTYASVPYYCDFEDSVENALWHTPNGEYVWNGKWYVGSYVSYSGNHSLYVSQDGGATGIYNSSASSTDKIWSYREFYLDPVYPQYVISFKHRGYGRCTPYFGPTNHTTLKQLCSGSFLPYDSIWMDHSFTFSVDTPGVYRLSFRWYKWDDNNKPGVSIDDISITGVFCLPPEDLASDNITDSSAILTWQHNCVDAPMGYLLGYKTAGDLNYTVITVNDTNAVTLTGLLPNTTYYWRVKTLYNDSVSTDWSSVASFQTDLVWVHPLPYTCDFEDATENLAWNVPVISGNNQNRWYIGHNTYSSANTSLYVTTNANGSNNNYSNQSESRIWAYRDLYLDPQHDGYELSFDAKVCGNPGYAFAQLYVGAPVDPTDSSAAENMVLLDSEIGPTGGYGSAVWQHFDYTLDSTFAGHRRLFFMWQTHPSSFMYTPAIAVDNISLSGTSCSRPLQLVSVVGDTTVMLSWQSATVGMPESYTVAYKATADSGYTQIETTDTTLTLTGILPLTDYTWKVRSNCSGEEQSEWSIEQGFRTLQNLAMMPYACGFEDSSENANWTSYYESSQHKWCIGSAVQHNGQYTTYISKDNGATYQTNNSNYAEAYLYRDFLFDPAYDEYLLEFDIKTFDTTNQTDISVYVESPASSDFAIPEMGSSVENICFNDNLWHHITIVLNRTHSYVQRLVFEWRKDYWNVAKGSCAVDDITLSGVAFGRPYALKALNVNYNSALLTWTSGNRQAPDSYQLAYREDTDTAYTVVTLTDTVWQAEILVSATSYHWKVRAVAADGTLSAWSSEATFYTAASTPYYTDFENDSDRGGWQVASESFDSDTWFIGTAVSHGGAYSLYVTHDGGVTNSSTTMYSDDTVSIYRDIYFVPGTEEYQVAFDYLGYGSSVWLQSLDSLGSSPQLVYTIPTSDQWQHHRFTVDTSFAGFRRLFLLRLYGTLEDKAGAVDNLEVSVSACPPPTSLVTTMTAPDAARFTWNSVGNEQYTVAYRPQSDSVYTMVDVPDTSVLITNLIPDIPYFWKVSTQCGDVPGDWSSECSFYTTPLLPYFCDFDDENEIAHWTYDHGSDWNYLTIGAAPMDSGNVTLHVGSAYGDGNYNYYATARLWAYRDIFLGGDVDKYQISFDYRGLGQTDVDFARVYLGPPATPYGLDAPEGVEQISGNLCMVPNWTHYSFEVDSSHSGLQRIYFQWRCDGSNGLNPGAAIDNIAVQCSDCPIPTESATLSTTATTATLSWHTGNADVYPISYTVAYKLQNDSVLTEVTTTDTLFQLTGLQPDSYYYWQVRSNCSDSDYSLWSNSVCFSTMQSIYATLPYECGFEDVDENAHWSFVHLSGPNDWMIGGDVHLSGDSALYVTDNNTTNHYTNGSVSQIWAYRDIYFTPGNDEYELSFDFKGKGSSSHYAKVFLGSPATPFETFTPEGAEQLGGSMYNQESWQHYHFYIDAAHSGAQRLYVMWTNNTYSASQPPAAFDNFEIVANPCREPVELLSIASDNSVTLSWTLRRGGQGTDYTVAYRLQSDTAYTYVTVSDTFVTVQNLLSNVFYYWKVKQNCGAQYSVWSEEMSFITNEDILYVCDFDTPASADSWQMIGNWEVNKWYIGRHDGSLPNGTLYISSDNGQTNSYFVSGITNCWAFTDVFVTPGHSTYYLSFDFKGMGEYNYDYVDVFVGPKVLPSDNNTPAGAVKLGSKLCMEEDWVHYQYTFDSTHTGLQRIYFLWHNDYVSGTNPPASIDNVCLSTVNLQPPTNLQVLPTDVSALLTWGIADTMVPASYTVSYSMMTDSLLSTVTVNDMMCNLIGLQPSTDYFVRVCANYANGESGLWRMGQFRTRPQLAHVPYYCDFEDSLEVDSWQFVSNGSVNQWVVDTAATSGQGHSLYVSNDCGATNAYTFNAATTTWAYRDFYIDPEQGPYQIHFDFRGVGEIYANTVYDYAKVFIGPIVEPNVSSSYSVVIPEGAVQIDTILYQRDEWTTYNDTFDVATNPVRLYILWRNDGSYGTNPAAAFDNISIVSLADCAPPIALTVDSVSKTEVAFHITDPFIDHHDWDVVVVSEEDTLDESQAVILHDTLSYTFTQLDSGTVYTLYVRTRCSDDNVSEWISLAFTTLPGDTTSHQDDDSVSVAQYQLDKVIKVYPNPTTNYVDVSANEDVNIFLIDIYDVYGRRLWYAEVQGNRKRIDLTGWSSGMYLMRFDTNRGIVTKRFVIR